MTENRSHGVSGLAVCGYEAEDEDYLSFPEGATIFEIEFPSVRTWSGIYEGRRALFPATNIEFQCSPCQYCKNLLSDHSMLDRLVSEGGVDLRVTRKDFRSAIEQGCSFFTPFYTRVKIEAKGCPELQPFRVLDNKDPCDDAKELTINCSATTKPDGGPYDIQSLKLEDSTGITEGATAVVYEVFANVDDPASTYVTTEPLGRVSSDSFRIAKLWTDTCFNSHEFCLRPELPTLPTRVIDIGPADGSEEPKLFLSRDHKGHYTALSYCWGGPQLFTLTTGTLDEKQQRLSMSDLPAAFCDAIKVTRSLEFQYLWIDALCIVQDSDTDKAFEIATMDQVHHNASVTICAANIASCSQSFLSTWIPASYPSSFQLSAIKFPCPDGAMGTILVEEKQGYSSSSEPLNQRGWALQERLLSPRVLTFGSIQMYWQCQTALCREGGTAEEFEPCNMWRLSDDFFQRNANGGIPTGVDQIYDRWYDIIEDYSTRQLTLRTDMLPALSGIATRFASMLNDSYCAGLWRNDLLNGLAWMAVGDKTRPSAYRAPSWSWASFDDGAIYLKRLTAKTDLVQLTKVVSSDIQPLHPTAPFGEVQAGTIELRGVVKDTDWVSVQDFEHADGNFLSTVSPDVDEETIGNAVEPGVGERAVFQTGYDVKQGDNAVSRPVSLLPIADTCSLILECQPDGKYVKLGLLSSFRDPETAEDLNAKLEEFYEGCTERTVVIR